jgi:putative membrane protein
MDLKLFLKGLLMGVCDLIPGISGGTIAFILGIYEKLMKSISEVLNFKFKNIQFLIILFSGIIIAIFLGSRIMNFLLNNYFIFLISFFMGLILYSGIKIIKINQIKVKKDLLLILLGFVVGFLLVFLVPLNVQPSLFYIFLGGFLAISAMFLPGISGSFILLIMGIYTFMIDVLKNLKIKEIVVFLLGALIGVYFISKLISLLFKKHKREVLFLLSGLIIGSLSVSFNMLLKYNIFFIELLLMLVLFVLGLFVIYILE